jgi:hypothetical protein
VGSLKAGDVPEGLAEEDVVDAIRGKIMFT